MREGEAVVAIVIDKKKAKPITSMMAGLARSIPNQFTDYIHVKEATSDGFILAYRISLASYIPYLWSSRTSTDSIRRELEKHLLSIGTSP